MRNATKSLQTMKPRSSLASRCEHCGKVLLIHEQRLCWLCGPFLAVYGKEVVAHG